MDWVGLGGAKLGLPAEPDGFFYLRFVIFAILLRHDYDENWSLRTQNSGTLFTFSGKVKAESCSNGDSCSEKL